MHKEFYVTILKSLPSQTFSNIVDLFVTYSVMSHQKEQEFSQSRRELRVPDLHPLDVVFGFLLDEVDAF